VHISSVSRTSRKLKRKGVTEGKKRKVLDGLAASSEYLLKLEHAAHAVRRQAGAPDKLSSARRAPR
jgi:hypothetical protein